MNGAHPARRATSLLTIIVGLAAVAVGTASDAACLNSTVNSSSMGSGGCWGEIDEFDELQCWGVAELNERRVVHSPDSSSNARVNATRELTPSFR